MSFLRKFKLICVKKGKTDKSNFFPESFAIKRSFETHVDGVGLVEELQKKFPEFQFWWKMRTAAKKERKKEKVKSQVFL